MAAFNKFQSFVEALAEKAHNLGADDLKILLTNDAPSAANDAVRADLTSELGTGGGYTLGGASLANKVSAQAAGVYKLTADDLVFTAAAGTIGPFRYAVLYNDTAAADELIGWWDYGSDITLNDGETFTVDLSAVNGVLQIT